MSFRFRLQKLLELRAQAEQASARRLAEARTDADAAQRAVEEIERAQQEDHAGRPVDGETRPAGELQRRALISSQIDDYLAAADETRRVADEAVTEMSSEFNEALARRRVLDKLKEKHQARYNGEQEQQDRAAMDAIALSRHGRKKDGDE
jgi:flagellar protein FliJ